MTTVKISTTTLASWWLCISTAAEHGDDLQPDIRSVLRELAADVYRAYAIEGVCVGADSVAVNHFRVLGWIASLPVTASSFGVIRNDLARALAANAGERR